MAKQLKEVATLLLSQKVKLKHTHACTNMKLLYMYLVAADFEHLEQDSLLLCSGMQALNTNLGITI